jgi:hypothetical protein
MVEKKLEFECPYCGKKPLHEKAPDVGGKELRELECLPYTRENGRIFHGGEWGRLGADFLGPLNWERIGILRISQSGVDVRFKNSQCEECKEYFDVYADYSGANIPSMCEMWGHLLGRKSDEVDSDNVAAYEGETLTGRVLRGLAGLFENDWAAAFLMALGVYLVFLAPLLWRNAPNLFGRNWSAVATEDWMTLLLRAGGAVCLAALLYLGYKYADFMRTEAGFYELFKVTRRRGITFWKNYSLSRAVGVQSGRGLPAVSQVALAAGVPSVLLLLVIWVSWRLAGSGLLKTGIILELAVWLLLAYAGGSLVEKGRDLLRKALAKERSTSMGGSTPPEETTSALPAAKDKNPKRKLGRLARGMKDVFLPLKPFGLVATLASLLIWTGRYLLAASRVSGPLTMDLFELGFWLVLSYYIGISMWLALNTAIYILNGVTRIPMNLSPLDHFRNSQILEKILAFSTTTILTIFFLVIFLMFCQVYGLATSTVGWLLQWARWGLIFLFVALSLASSRTPLLYAIAYSVISMALVVTPLTGDALDRARLFVLGSFLSLLLYFHYTRSHSPIEEIRTKYKNLELKKCDERIRRVQLQLNEMEGGDVQVSSPLQEKANLKQQFVLCYEELSNLLELREKIEREPTKVRSSHYRNIAKALSPMVTSTILSLGPKLMGRWVDMLWPPPIS